MKPANYAKAIVAAIGAAATAVLGIVPPSSPLVTVLTALVAVCTVIGTYMVPNAPSGDTPPDA